MARSKRRGPNARQRRPSRYADGNAIPRELLALTPPSAPVSYLGGREHVSGLALQIFAELPELEHAVLMIDVLGGVHGVRCFEIERGLSLSDVADLVVLEVEDAGFPAHLIYLSRGTCVPNDASKQWNTMRFRHGEPPYLVDALIVSPEHARVLSLANQFGRERVPENN